jgi:hypothetical protein
MTACAAPNNAAGGHSRAPGPYSGFAQTAPQRRPTLTDITITQNAPVLVAIDISKARHEVLIAIPDKKRRRRLTVLNQLDDFNRLITLLASYGRPVRVAFEATGNYHRALAYHLAAAGFELKLVSSVALARTREDLLNSWDKSDPKNAQWTCRALVPPQVLV